MPITPLFAAFFGLFYVALSLYVIRFRLKHQVSLGDDDHMDLRTATRIHANFIEYVPLAIILLWFYETISFSSHWVFVLSSVLLLSRIAHVYGMLYPAKAIILRKVGMLGTFAVIIAVSAMLVFRYIPFN